MFLRVWGAGSPDDRYLLGFFELPAMGNLITFEAAAHTDSFA
jgi:hypothetical protein